MKSKDLIKILDDAIYCMSYHMRDRTYGDIYDVLISLGLLKEGEYLDVKTIGFAIKCLEQVKNRKKEEGIE